LLNRTLTYETSIEEALKLGFLSFDATQVSASDVDYPIDVVVYHKNSFHLIEHRLEKGQMADVTKQWNALLKNSVDNLQSEWISDILGV
ncbi:MAG: peptidase, partial [Arcicella sp.]|nr:peptidase [Arcicella sp.]